ncbi:DUF6314 family protein [Paracoccus ravus]|uniref:DUF6314 family protein n=1 Tax=Paracoccus ravus TaxID=2447760 RepID=UPI00106EC2F6|nr:DUF6314 family protein [Paracoccus ravus]
MAELDPKAFLGNWRVRRRISDAATGWISLFRGQAEITPTSFFEEGTIRFRDQTFPAERRYLLDWQPSELVIRRPDGSFFIALTPNPQQQVTHHCGDDLYQGRFLFSGHAWVEIWEVTGPRKNYCSISHYSRLPASGHAG